MKAMSQRQERMAEVVRQVVARALVDGSVPLALAGQQTARLTLSDIWISADLRIAKCFISGTADSTEEIIAGLNAGAGGFRKLLAKRLENKYIPSVRFLPDDMGEKALRAFADLRASEAANK